MILPELLDRQQLRLVSLLPLRLGSKSLQLSGGLNIIGGPEIMTTACLGKAKDVLDCFEGLHAVGLDVVHAAHENKSSFLPGDLWVMSAAASLCK